MHVDPVVEDDLDLLESSRPGLNLLLEHLVVRRHLHRVDVVHVLVTLFKQVVPSSDQLGFRLVLDKLELVNSPALLDTVEEVLEDSLTSCLSQDVLDDLVSTEEIGVPQVAKM